MPRHLTVVVPAGGYATRFARANIYVPKGLIELDSVPMLVRAVGEAQELGEVLVGVPAADIRLYEERLRPWRETFNVVAAERVGQAAAVLHMLAHVPDGEVLVINCDQGFAPGVLRRFVHQCREAQLTECHMRCGVITMPSDDPAHGYVDAIPWFTIAAEKRVLSTHALAGAFWFQNARALACAITELFARMHQAGGTSIYLSQALNVLRPGGRYAMEIPRNQVYSWGTPEELFRERELAIQPDVLKELLKYHAYPDR